MTTEEKARAYDGALERAQKATRAGSDVAMDMIQYIFPELGESEDEKINNFIQNELACIRATEEKGSDRYVDLTSAISYLERQKDSVKAMSAVEKIDKYIDTHTANAHDMDDSNPDKKYYQGRDDALGKIAGILQDVYSGEEQKDYNKLYEDIANSEWFKKTYVGKTFGCDYEQKEQKPAKWSEEDEKFIKDLCNLLVSLAKDNRVGCYYAPDLINKIKSLHPQPKQEWSEEDGKTIDEAVEYIEKYAEYVQGGFSKQYVLDVAKRIDSLRPQPKQEWGEGDENKLYQVMETLLADKAIALRENPHCKALHRAYDELIDWLKSLPKRFNLLPEQEWSEKDKEMLARVFELIRYADDHYEFDGKEVSSVDVKAWLLKSLCPQPKREWSKEDKDKIEDILLIIKHAANIPYSGGILTINNEYKDELSKFLKSFVPNAEN